MWQYFSGGSGTTSVPKPVSKYDDKVPPPPSGGAFMDPPKAPRGVNTTANSDVQFTGFSAPPKVKDYSSGDYSNYILSDTSYLDSGSKTSGFLDNFTSNPRTRNCVESIKLGFRMGGMVGGIFGGLTGLYTSVKHRNLMVLPVSVIGGAISFGFFLGCGMVVRC